MGVAAQMIGDLVTGRVTDTTDFSTATLEESTDSTGPGNGEYLSAFLRWRAQNQSDTLLFTLVDAKVRIHEDPLLTIVYLLALGASIKDDEFNTATQEGGEAGGISSRQTQAKLRRSRCSSLLSWD